MKTVSANLLRGIIEICCNQGADRAILMQGLPNGEAYFDDISPESVFPRLPVCILLVILDKAVRMTGKTHIGLNCGRYLPQYALGVLGHSILLSKNINQALEIKSRYQPLYQQIGRSKIEIKGDKTWLTSHLGEEITNPDHKRILIDINMAAHASIGYWLAWCHNTKFVEVRFSYAKPDYYQEYENIFDCPIKFGQKVNAIILNTEDLHKDLPQSDPILLNKLCVKMDKQLKLLNSHGHIKDMAYIILYFNNDITNLPKLAARMNLSDRTLRRKLQQENTNFRQLFEMANQTKSKIMLSQGMPLKEIAAKLGYSQQSSFNRAFKSWYSQSPKAYLRSLNRA